MPKDFLPNDPQEVQQAKEASKQAASPLNIIRLYNKKLEKRKRKILIIALDKGKGRIHIKHAKYVLKGKVLLPFAAAAVTQAKEIR